MREIKFRGKRIDNGEWVYGYLCMTKWTSCTPVENKGTWHEPKYEATEEYAHQVKCLEINKGRWWFAAIQQTKNLNSILEVDPKTVGQYTGLKDKKGKEIYEGDTFSWILEDCYVGWCNECKSLQVKIIETGECMACLGDLHWYELIELLTEGKVWVKGNIEEPEGGKEE